MKMPGFNAEAAAYRGPATATSDAKASVGRTCSLWFAVFDHR